MLQIDKELVQWEVGRTLTVNNPNIVFVEFYNKNSEIGLIVPVANGVVQVPNILLTENLPIIAFACVGDKNKTKAISQKIFKVIARTKPADYVYTETEVQTYEKLDARIKALEENGGGGSSWSGVAESGLDMTGHEIRSVGQVSFTCDEEGIDQDTGSSVSLLASVQRENNENAYDLSFRGFNRKVSLPQKVRLSNIAGGTQDSDAATVGQVKKTAPYLLVAEETDEGKGVLAVGDWDTMVLELKKGRSIILAGTGILSSESDVSVSIYHLAVAYQEDGYAVFFHTDERTHSIAIVRYDGAVEFKYVNLLELDPTLSLSGNYAAPASVVGKKLGNIETALDSIIAIQESLIGGGGE